MALLEINNLCKNFGSVVVLNQLNLKLDGGKIVTLLGINGSGKTTLFKILAGMDLIYRGEVRLDGHRPGAATKAFVSFLPDGSNLPGRQTPQQLLTFYQDFYRDFDIDKARDMIKDFKLDANRRLETFSLGMKEKLQVALCMSRRAKIYLLDEPISGVDPLARQFIMSGILKNYSEDALMIISTHLVKEMEAITDDVLLLQNGQIQVHADAESLRETYGQSIEHIYMEALK